MASQRTTLAHVRGALEALAIRTAALAELHAYAVSQAQAAAAPPPAPAPTQGGPSGG